MCNGYVVDLIVIELRITMRENVAEPYDVAGVRNRFRNGGRHSVEMLMLQVVFDVSFGPQAIRRIVGRRLDLSASVTTMRIIHRYASIMDKLRNYVSIVDKLAL